MSDASLRFFRKPHSKKRRIVKKWMARKENWRECVFFTQSGIIAGPSTFQALSKYARDLDKTKYVSSGGTIPILTDTGNIIEGFMNTSTIHRIRMSKL